MATRELVKNKHGLGACLACCSPKAQMHGYSGEYSFYVFCPECGMRAPKADNADHARMQWNTLSWLLQLQLQPDGSRGPTNA